MSQSNSPLTDAAAFAAAALGIEAVKVPAWQEPADLYHIPSPVVIVDDYIRSLPKSPKS